MPFDASLVSHQAMMNVTEMAQAVRDLLRRSTTAYRAIPGLSGRAVLTQLATSGFGAELGSETTSITYASGRGTDASFVLEDYGGISLGERAYLTRSDRPGVYIDTALIGDLPTTIKSVFGVAMFVPPQLAMRAGQDDETIMEAIGLGLITNLAPTAFKTLANDDSKIIHQVEFRGDQGRVSASFFAESALLIDIVATVGEARFAYAIESEATIPPEEAVRIAFNGRAATPALSDLGSLASVGKPAPDFTLGTIGDDPRTLADASGSLLIIEFWALWCGPCVQGMPTLEALARRLSAEAAPVTIWTVAIVEGQDEPGVLDRIRDLWSLQRLTMPVLIDRDGRVAEQYGVKALPTIVAVNAQGVVMAIESGLAAGDLEHLIRDA